MPSYEVSNENGEGRIVETVTQLAALNQIHAAIWLFRINEFECAITLAGAAECLIPSTDARLAPARDGSAIARAGRL